MKILLTGGAGFIGSNVVDAYVAAGHEVTVVDDLSSGKRENINPAAGFVELDVRSPEIAKVVAAVKPDLVNHHAAQISVPDSVEDPVTDADINIKGLLNILEASRKAAVKKVIFVSSGGAVYGEAEAVPTPESHPASPMSPYAVTKLAGEMYLAFYASEHGLDYTVLRYSNVYGPRQIPKGEAGVVAIFLDRLLAGDECHLYQHPGEPRGMERDYCFVSDVVEANVAALTKGGSGVYNIGTGVATHTLDLFNELYEALVERGQSIDSRLDTPVPGPARGGDIKRSCLDASKASAELGWKARVNIKEGLSRTLDWRLP